jgi:hypothetical protein
LLSYPLSPSGNESTHPHRNESRKETGQVIFFRIFQGAILSFLFFSFQQTPFTLSSLFESCRSTNPTDGPQAKHPAGKYTICMKTLNGEKDPATKETSKKRQARASTSIKTAEAILEERRAVCLSMKESNKWAFGRIAFLCFACSFAFSKKCK